jgi:hypothetical protein
MIDLNDKQLGHDNELDAIYAMNRVFRGSQRLINEPTYTRRSLFGAALTLRAASDFPRTALLLADHVDLLYEISMEAVGNHVMLESTASVGERRELKRKRETVA